MKQRIYPFAKADTSAVAELTGLDGPFVFPEKLLQQIWLRREFDQTRAMTTDGRRVTVRFPGRWNLLGGPDFREARLELDGEAVTGDVEVHARAGDWRAHGHSRDPAYRAVVLHVVLFPTADSATEGCEGHPLPILPLLPLLFHDLEEYAADAAVAAMANRPSVQIVEWLGRLGEQERRAVLWKHATARWRDKVRFAGLRLERLGWEGACHHTALEILGYRFNRVPMLRLATLHPLEAWAEGRIHIETVYETLRGEWALQGVRPANQPRARLRQYAHWCRERSNWPERLLAWAAGLEEAGRGGQVTDTREFRRTVGVGRIRKTLGGDVCAGAITGSRLDTLVCDGLLPLLAAKAEAAGRFEALWWHWPEGDVPAFVHRGLKDLALIGEPRAPACHGLAQGLIGGLLARDAPT